MNVQQIKCRCGSVLKVPPESTTITCPRCQSTLKLDDLNTRTQTFGSAVPSQFQVIEYRKSKPMALIVGVSIAGVILLATGVIAAVLIYSDNEEVPGQKTAALNDRKGKAVDSLPDTTSGELPTPDMVRIASLPEHDCGSGVTEFISKELFDAVPFDIVRHYDAMDPDSNQLVEFLHVLALFDDEPNIWISDKNQAQLRRIDRDVLKKISAAIDKSNIDPKLLEATNDAVDQLEELFNGNGSRVPCPPNFEALLPHMQAKRAVARVLQARALFAIQSRNETDFIRESRLLAGLSTFINKPRLFVGDLVDVAIAGILIAVIEEAFSSDFLSEEGVKHAHAILLEVDLARSESKIVAMEAEHLLLLNLSIELKNNPATRVKQLQNILAMSGVETAIPTTVAMQLSQMSPKDFDAWIAEINRIYGEYYKASDGHEIVYSDLLELAKRHSVLLKQVVYRRDNLLLTLGTPVNGQYLIAMARNLIDIRGWQCICALSLWNQRIEQPPGSIQELFREVTGQAPPLDPFDGQPMRMVEVNGRTVFYAIGPDGKDDGGKFEWNGYGMDSGGDRVFKMPE